jgi:cell division protein FtsA
VDKNYIVAVDLGSNNVVVAVGSRAGNRINVESVVVEPSAGVEGGEVKNVESASAAIRRAVEQAQEALGIRISEACTGLSGNHLRCARHPYYVHVAGKDGEISAADVRLLNDSMRNIQAPEGYKLMHIMPQHYTVDAEEEIMEPVGRFGKTLGSTFNLVIGKTTIIQRLEKALQKAGLGVSRIFINPLAMAEAVTVPDEKSMGVAVVDIGAGTTDVCIYFGGIVRHVSVIPMGADAVNKDIQAYGILERYVEELKTKYGCAVADMVDGEKKVKVPSRLPNDHKELSFRNLAAIIEARMTDIVDYVMQEIEAAGYNGKLAAGIVLTGGGAMLQEIAALFEKKTGLDVRVAQPNVVVAAESKDLAADLRAAAAVGLLWQGMMSGVETRVEGVRPVAAAAPEEQNPDEVDFSWEKPKPVKPPRKGIFGKIKEAFNKAIDSDVLDDDTMI